MNETNGSRDLSTAPKDSREVATEFKTGGTRCSARSTRTGEPCKRPAMLGGNVCRAHGGAAPQVKAKAQRRLQQAADALVQRLLGMALDGDTPDHVALAAIRDALDRAGLGARQAVEVGVQLKPYEQVLKDMVGVAHITQAEHRARQGLPPLPAAPADDAAVIDAEVVDAATECGPRGRTPGDRADDPTDPAAPVSAALVPLDDAVADAGETNRRAQGCARAASQPATLATVCKCAGQCIYRVVWLA